MINSEKPNIEQFRRQFQAKIKTVNRSMAKSDWRAVSERTPPSCNAGKPNKDTKHDDGV